MQEEGMEHGKKVLNNGESKREINEGEEDDEEEGEEKVEKFYAIIRRFREARDKRREELRESEKKKKKKKMRRLNGEQSTWIPSFQWEDFSQEIEFRRPPLIFPSPCNKRIDDDKQQQQLLLLQHQREADVDDAGLDLKLTL